MKLRDQRLVQRIPSLGPVQSQLNNNAVLVLDGRESVEGVTGDKEGRGLRRRRGGGGRLGGAGAKARRQECGRKKLRAGITGDRDGAEHARLEKAVDVIVL